MEGDIPRPALCLKDQNLNTKNQMHAAIKSNDLCTVKKIMELYNFKPNEECSEEGHYWTALHYAAHFNSLGAFSHLCRNVYQNYLADFVEILNLQTKEGWTPLMISAIYKQKEITKYLLRVGGQKLHAKDINGKTAIDLAGFYGASEIKTLLEEAKEKIAKEDTETPVNTLFLEETKELEKNGDEAIKKANAEIDIELIDEFASLLQFGTRLPCLICQVDTGHIQYTDCCGQPLHYFCIGKIKTCPNCNHSGITLTSAVKFPERAFTHKDE